LACLDIPKVALIDDAPNAQRGTTLRMPLPVAREIETFAYRAALSALSSLWRAFLGLPAQAIIFPALRAEDELLLVRAEQQTQLLAAGIAVNCSNRPERTRRERFSLPKKFSARRNADSCLWSSAMWRRPANPRRQQKYPVIPFLLLGVCSISPLQADDLTTASGHTFHNVQVTSRSNTTLVIQSTEGQAVVPISDLKPGDKERFSKDLTKAMELPALTVIGEQKPDFTKTQPDSRIETIADKEFRRQTQERKDKAEDKALHPQYKPMELAPGLNLGVGAADLKNDSATKPTYLTPEYQSLAPEIVEKQLRVFADEVGKGQQ
jgi:hypothetical protein